MSAKFLVQPARIRAKRRDAGDSACGQTAARHVQGAGGEGGRENDCGAAAEQSPRTRRDRDSDDAERVGPLLEVETPLGPNEAFSGLASRE